MQWDAETDVLVIGGGGGGLVAAISASERDVTVALIEKTGQLGGNTALSSGSVPGAGTRFQQEAGIEDSPELMAADLMRRTNGTAPEHLVHLLARESAPLVEWLVDEIGVPLKLVADLKKVGHSVPRTHVPPGRQGTTLVETLEQAAIERDVFITPGNPAKQLITDAKDAVIGAVVQSGGSKKEYRVSARKVILACNGFGANREMLRRFIPEIADIPYFGHEENTGEGIQWGMELGARLCNMQSYQGHASVSHPFGALMSWTAMEQGGFLVDQAGLRFVDENLGYSACAANVLQQPEHIAYAVIDARTHDYMTESVPDFVDILEHGGVKTADDIRDVAKACGIDSEKLAATLASFNEAARTGNDTFGREDFGHAPLEAPYSIIKVTAGLFHTQGGLEVNGNAQPICNDDSVIKNLYAVGGVAVGVSGADNGKGYCSANGLLAALGLGRVAGRHAAKTL
jgi:fumarate reductase flavoprotein subunit